MDAGFGAERVAPRAVLVLEDGATYAGHAFGAIDQLPSAARLDAPLGGEVAFNTTMAGHQEICADPSYCGQMVVLTYLMTGNYGYIVGDEVSVRPWLSALLVREIAPDYSHWRACGRFERLLVRWSIPGTCGLDTRALTRHLAGRRTLRGILCRPDPGRHLNLARLAAYASQIPPTGGEEMVRQVSKRDWPVYGPHHGAYVLLVDCGAREPIAHRLARAGLRVSVVPADQATPRLLRASNVRGIVLSNGPCDPRRMPALVRLARGALDAAARGTPVLGVCLGHQLLALAAGAHVRRLPFGHHGANHPVRDERTGHVSITAQNHSFEVIAASIPATSGFSVCYRNLTDGSVEGLAHHTLPVVTVQFHPEAAPGPLNDTGVIAEFAGRVREGGRREHCRTATGVARSSENTQTKQPIPIQPICGDWPCSAMTGTRRLPPVSANMRS